MTDDDKIHWLWWHNEMQAYHPYFELLELPIEIASPVPGHRFRVGTRRRGNNPSYTYHLTSTDAVWYIWRQLIDWEWVN